MATVLGAESSRSGTVLELRDADDGRLLATARVAHRDLDPYRQDPASWWDSLVEAAGRLAAGAGPVLDVAAVAVAALTEDGHDGQIYEVTGPRLVTFADLAAELTAAVRRPITYLPVTPAEFVAGAIDHGVPTAEAEMLGELFAEILDGHNSHLTDGVVRALGRQPRDIGDYIAQTATTGVWNVEARV